MALCPSADVLPVSNVFLVADFTRILSLARDCLATSGSPTGISCDNNLQPTCVRYCRTHLCNDQDGDLHKRISPPDDGGTGVTSLLRSSVFLVVCSWLIPSVVKWTCSFRPTALKEPFRRVLSLFLFCYRIIMPWLGLKKDKYVLLTEFIVPIVFTFVSVCV